MVLALASERINIDPILDAVKRTHPSFKSRISEYVDKLVSIIDSYIDNCSNLTDEELMYLAEKLEKIRETSYYVYNELRQRTKYPSILDQAVSKLRWRNLQKKLGHK